MLKKPRFWMIRRMLIVGLLMWSGTALVRAQGPMIHIESASALMDEVVKIRVSGLPPQGKVALTARAQWHGQAWQAQASFIADQNGEIDVAVQAPVSGSYTGRDAMGLFWSMRPSANKNASGHHVKPDVREPQVTHLELEIAGRSAATAECRRWFAKPGVQMREVSSGGLQGHLYVPAETGKHPAILVLGGSEGGQDDFQAAFLASHGYTSLALAYFGARGLPAHLVDVPLEYFDKAIDWLTAQSCVDASRLGIFGSSKGGELALLLASRTSVIKAVVAVAPSNVVWEGIGGESSSWSYQNVPLPFVPFRQTNRSAKLVDAYRQSLAGCPNVDRFEIPVEKIKGAVLLLTGRDDQLWPSADMAERVLNRLKRNGFPCPAQHLCYEKAGHAIPSAYIPALMTVQAGRLPLGGSPEANAKAQADSRPKVLQFLKDHL
jgi:dienelactone hydrolase